MFDLRELSRAQGRLPPSGLSHLFQADWSRGGGRHGQFKNSKQLLSVVDVLLLEPTTKIRGLHRLINIVCDLLRRYT